MFHQASRLLLDTERFSKTFRALTFQTWQSAASALPLRHLISARY
jgi:hypothetical protein